MAGESYWLRTEGHHTDSSGSGPANLYVNRATHTEIHTAVGDTLRELDLPRGGFCGDATTLKPGNPFWKP